MKVSKCLILKIFLSHYRYNLTQSLQKIFAVNFRYKNLTDAYKDHYLIERCIQQYNIVNIRKSSELINIRSICSIAINFVTNSLSI